MAAVVTTEEFQALMERLDFKSVSHEESAEKGFFFYSTPWHGVRVASGYEGEGNVLVEFSAKTSLNPTPWWRFWLSDGADSEAVSKLWAGDTSGSCRLTQQYTRLGAPIFLEESVKGLSPAYKGQLQALLRVVEDAAVAMTEEGKAAAAAAEEAKRVAREREMAGVEAAFARANEEMRERRERAKDRIARLEALPPYLTTQVLYDYSKPVIDRLETVLPPGDVSDWKLFCKNTTFLGNAVLHEWTWQRVEIPEE